LSAVFGLFHQTQITCNCLHSWKSLRLNLCTYDFFKKELLWEAEVIYTQCECPDIGYSHSHILYWLWINNNTIQAELVTKTIRNRIHIHVFEIECLRNKVNVNSHYLTLSNYPKQLLGNRCQFVLTQIQFQNTTKLFRQIFAQNKAIQIGHHIVGNVKWCNRLPQACQTVFVWYQPSIWKNVIKITWLIYYHTDCSFIGSENVLVLHCTATKCTVRLKVYITA